MAAPFEHIQPSHTGTARRSHSIFSRKGAETPTPATQALAAAAAMPFPPALPSGTPVVRQKKWKLGSRTEKKPQGTILRMVPKEQPMSGRIVSPPEPDTTLSPNDEILRNIGLEPTEMSSPISMTSSRPAVEFKHILHQMKSARMESNKSQGEIIGVWKNGKAEWDSRWPALDEEPIARPMTADSRPKFDSLANDRKPQRPSIRIVIPNRDSIRRPLQMLSRSAVEPNSRHATGPRSEQDVPRAELSPTPRSTAMPVPTLMVAPKPQRVSYTSASLAAVIERSMTPPPQYSHQQPSDRVHVHFRMPSTNSSSDSSSLHSSDNDASPKVSSSKTSLMSVASDERGSESPKPAAEEKVVPVILDPQLRSSYAASVSAQNQRPLDDPPFGSPESPAELEGSAVDVPRLGNLLEVMRRESIGYTRRRMSSRRGTRRLSQKTPRDALRPSGAKSPSLSQAEQELEKQLEVFGISVEAAKNSPSELVTVVMQSGETAPPPIPPKSAQRRHPQPASMQVKKRKPYRVDKPLPPLPRKSSRRKSAPRKLSFISEEQERKISAKRAEALVFKILNNLDTLDDLFNAALTNKGFYLVFKRNELQLMRKTLKKMNQAAWEYRETCLYDDISNQLPETPKLLLDYTPTSYYQTYIRDVYIIGALKTIILEQCQSFLRVETVQSLKVHEPLHSSRVDTALWRIWTFCRVFGCNKGREDDIAAQLDWLRGGILAHQDDCTGTIASSDSLALSGLLLNAPEHFGKGNNGGLSAEELFDMTEMWNCLNHITQSILGRTAEARQYGVFDDTDIRGGDVDGEEAMLEEWHSYLVSLGLGPILSLALHTARDNSSIFVLSKQSGWTNWTPPTLGGSRSTFLKEAVARVYEEKICDIFASDNSKSEEIKRVRRTRGKTFAAEIRQRRMNGGSVHSERPMSGWVDAVGNFSSGNGSAPDASSTQQTTSVRRLVVPLDLALVRPISGQTMSRSSYSSDQESLVHPALRNTLDNPARVAPSALPPSPPPSANSLVSPPAHSPRSHSSSRTSLAATQQHPRQREMADLQAPNSVDRKIFQIVEMGFSPEEAKEALKETDMGDELRVDHAVDFLLRRADAKVRVAARAAPCTKFDEYAAERVRPCSQSLPLVAGEAMPCVEHVLRQTDELTPINSHSWLDVSDGSV